MNSIFTPFPDTLWVRKEIKFGYSCSLGKILHSWYRQSSFLHEATPRARDGLSVSRVQDFAEKALVPKLDSYIKIHNRQQSSHDNPQLPGYVIDGWRHLKCRSGMKGSVMIQRSWVWIPVRLNLRVYTVVLLSWLDLNKKHQLPVHQPTYEFARIHFSPLDYTRSHWWRWGLKHLSSVKCSVII